MSSEVQVESVDREKNVVVIRVCNAFFKFELGKDNHIAFSKYSYERDAKFVPAWLFNKAIRQAAAILRGNARRRNLTTGRSPKIPSTQLSFEF